ncbi:coiled-coil domain-containing [Brachionus plicatilis]|uniref:Coiled-coil domain-containing n=1 Tax=Brachionus plicatilis TaxID=10195 RepID=A0A3M7SMA8_BRAPC|nr:coiled-coil domain-containing [Brachionus plicatilis]
MLHYAAFTELNSNDADYDKYIANIQRKIWEEVQIKISTYFRSMDLVNFKFDDYLDILVILNRFIELGNEFCNKASDCDIIIQAVKEQTLAYINFYHLSHLEELKMFLENEIWQCCPVRSDFSVFNLHEYKFLQSNEGQTPSDSVLELIEKNISSDLERLKANTFEINNNMVQLINISGDKKTKIDIFDEINLLKKKINSKNNESPQSSPTQSSDSVEDEFDEHLVQNFDAHNSINQEQPILTNTTLNIIRLFGKYIHMLSIFKIISFQVISYLMQLFQFYFYYIYLDFAQTDEIPMEQNDGSILNLIDKNSTLNTLFKNIKNDIFKKSKMSSPRMEQTKIVQNHDEYMDLVRQRIIATESLVYLSKLLENMFPLIKKILPMKQLKQNEINNLDIYTNILRETPKIRKTIYSYIARRAVDYNQLVDSIGRVNWDLNEILSQHNSYVDVLLRQLNDLKLDLQDLCAQIPLNKTIINSILEETLRLCMRVLVDGYSLVKKCSNEGRALMQLDFQQLVVKLEALFDIRPIPDKDYVETFIKAYYLPDSSIEKWVKDHPEYQQKNIAGLLGLMGQLSKKTRLAVLNSFQPGTLGSNNINASQFVFTYSMKIFFIQFLFVFFIIYLFYLCRAKAPSDRLVYKSQKNLILSTYPISFSPNLIGGPRK